MIVATCLQSFAVLDAVEDDGNTQSFETPTACLSTATISCAASPEINTMSLTTELRGKLALITGCTQVDDEPFEFLQHT